MWTRQLMQASLLKTSRLVIRYSRMSGFSFPVFYSPRARMEIRGPGPYRLRELESSSYARIFPLLSD